ncbi:hypothetical protein CTI12_AA163730 [Artemisia annua]|uniref:Uncharacterized protein n=1 Tax=Artemisia annua TaxID=35608 RepID=A0A2U1PE22_ARTAN|nr:hypothetical protein CTI12_AA163730 [Artemisia annua]
MKEANKKQYESEKMIWELKKGYDLALKDQAKSIRRLENQVRKIAEFVRSRYNGELPSTTETNPRDLAHAITTRSGLNYKESAYPVESGKQVNPFPNVEQTNAEERNEEPVPPKEKVRAYIPPIPFPVRMRKEREHEQFKQFMERIQQLSINIPLVEALEKMPKLNINSFITTQQLNESADYKITRENRVCIFLREVRDSAEMRYKTTEASATLEKTDDGFSEVHNCKAKGKKVGVQMPQKQPSRGIDVGKGAKFKASKPKQPVPRAANARIGVPTYDLAKPNEVINVASLIKMKHDYIVSLFGVSLITLEDINEFTLNCEAGKYPIWADLDSNARTMVMDALVDLWNAFAAEIKDKSTTPKPTNESPIVQAMDINTNSTFYVGAAVVSGSGPAVTFNSTVS